MFRKVILGISGGVDSAVAGYLLKQKGFDVRAVFMKNWDLVNETGFCSAEKDWEDTQYVCDKVQIPIQRINFVKQYWTDVFETTLQLYQNGQTPNPDVYCNKYIKFGAFYQYAKENLSADAIATGHYARTSFGNFLQDFDPNQNVKLLQAIDRRKDQTFFLSQIPQDALRNTMFPIGNYLKSEVKKIAYEIGLESIAKKDYVTEIRGDFVNIETGRIVTQHKGIHNYTIGQKINYGGQKEALFTVHKMSDKKTILVAPGRNHPTLLTDLFYTEQPHWINRSPFNGNVVVRASFRFQHGHRLEVCDLVERDGGLLVKLDNPVRAICPGQFSVFYRDNECLGSAKIHSTGPHMRNAFNIQNEKSDDETMVSLAKRVRQQYMKEKEDHINESERLAEKLK
ncbi:mitochondrial tRNA-specific 2-thiouridylase 1 isoform X2 [Contarinia nasturtii]|uniref:mitochondrial tRNA-specific 2-thiouridylase 1 isoform X2 n=1 Tax=Contarinia nasturtii TaxID=265458 RepID=UPI0012D46AC0|nr:mitochondrial tRNA-specific 2-thiouridylase 1 isoform X2 [Contarinia nasturtii]